MRNYSSRAATSTAILAFTIAGFTVAAAKADDIGRGSPPDNNSYSRAVVSEDFDPLNTAGKSLGEDKAVQFDVFVADTVVNNTDPDLKNTDTFNDGEVSIAIKPQHPSEIVITAFSGSWGLRAPLWRSRNRGNTWTKEFTVNPPSGVGGVPGCPCDQTVDFTQFKDLAGAFLTLTPDNIYSALNRNPAALTFHYFESPPGVAQATNHLDGVNDVDQPWLLVGPQLAAGGENVYVAYDDFTNVPNLVVRVAVATASDPLVFNIDHPTGSPFNNGVINPGHRLAIDQTSGAVYSLFQNWKGSGAGGSQNIDYMLNRSTDGGNTWSLNGSSTGIVVANADSTQPRPKFCTVNALLGGVDHAAVDPQTGDVAYVYGTRDPTTGNNRLALRRLSDDGAGGLAIGPEIFITGQVQAAIPSVGITDKGTIGVFYYTCDGTSSTGFPIFTAHFAVSTDRGATFTGLELETFLSPATDNSDPRQRVLGDYMQVKVLENQFYGGFTGNGVPFGRTFSNNDPIFYNVSVEPHKAKIAGK
jgi:hypothetical protein